MVGSRLRFLLVFVAVTAAAQNYGEFAQKIAAKLKPRETVALSFHNLTSMNMLAAKAAFEQELRSLGIQPSQSGTEVVVTLSENLDHAVWVAQIGSETVIETGPKPTVNLAPSMTINKTLVVESDQQILDLAPMSKQMLVLDAEAVSVYENSERKLSVRLPLNRPLPRDVRGRLTVQGDAYQAYLPGLTCHGNAGGGLGISCRNESLWPVGSGPGMLGFAQFNSLRNFFDGRLVSPNGTQKTVPAFFSAASVGDKMWAFAGTDGRTHLENASSWTRWGSDIAGIESDCGERSQILATAPGDDTVTDSVEAYEVVGGSPQPVGDAVSFPGPVTAIWPAAERGTAFAVSHDLKSGRYAAFRLSIHCTH